MKADVLAKMRTLPPTNMESKKAFGEMNVKLSTLEARVRQTVSASVAQLEMKKVESPMADVAKAVEAAEAASKVTPATGSRPNCE